MPDFHDIGCSRVDDSTYERYVCDYRAWHCPSSHGGIACRLIEEAVSISTTVATTISTRDRDSYDDFQATSKFYVVLMMIELV